MHCVISIGKANLPAFAPKRKELEKVCGMNEEQLAQLGAWQKEAVLAARLAPSAINQQPWKIAADKTSVSILETTVLYKKYAPLDRGICMRMPLSAPRRPDAPPSGKKWTADTR